MWFLPPQYSNDLIMDLLCHPTLLVVFEGLRKNSKETKDTTELREERISLKKSKMRVML